MTDEEILFLAGKHTHALPMGVQWVNCVAFAREIEEKQKARLAMAEELLREAERALDKINSQSAQSVYFDIIHYFRK